MSSGFISEAEIAEQRKVRQEEWNKIRTEDQPLAPPEEPYDSKSLYERLQERRNERDIEYEEAHKFKNMIKGLDDDEVEFLDLVDRTKFEEERKKYLEEEKEMRDFKAAVSSLQEKTLHHKLMQELQEPQQAAKVSSQSAKSVRLKILSGIVKKTEVKNKQNVKDEKQLDEENDAKNKSEEIPSTVTNSSESSIEDNFTKCIQSGIDVNNKNMQCIGILPGLGFYTNSSDSDCSSDTDEEHDKKKMKYDILGRQIVCSEDKNKS